MGKEQLFYDTLKKIFIGVDVSGKIESGYINLIKTKTNYFNKILKIFQKEINEKLKTIPEFREELFDKLYTFFIKYFSEIGSIYFQYTPLHENIYEKIYTEDKDVFLFWKTHMLYYVKSERIFENMSFKTNGFKFCFSTSKLDKKLLLEKKNIFFEYEKKEDDDSIHLYVINAQETKKGMNEIIVNAKKDGINIDKEILQKAFTIFKKQSQIDYFINKNSEKFLKEQFNLWFYQYIFSGESKWTVDRIEQLQILKYFVYKLIDFISQFENELVKIWKKPKFAINSNYVITLDRISEKNLDIIKKILKHPNFNDQVEEWEILDILLDDLDMNDIILNTLEGKVLNPKFKYFPIDTSFFKDLELEIIGIFENLYESLDGWLIKSENYQAMLTLIPKFNNKIQTAYIDPPFNTGEDFDYIDRFQDSTWLTLMENRINLVKELLNDKGSIFLHLDENANYLGKHLLNLVFSKGNFRSDITHYLGPNLKREIIPEKFPEQTEVLYHYSKTSDYVFNKIATIRPKYLIGLKGNDKKNIRNKYLDYFKTLLKDPEDIILFENGLFPAYNPNFIVKKDKLKSGNKTKTIIKEILLPYWEDNDFILKNIFKKVEIDDEQEDKYFIDIAGNIWLDIFSTRYSAINYRETEYFSTQKVEKLLARIILSTSNKNDIILDPFLGTGTSIAVAQKLKRKWVGIEMGEQFNDKVIPRIKRVIAGIRKIRNKKGRLQAKFGISKMVNWQGGGFFKYYEIEQYEDTLKSMKYEDSDFFKHSEKDSFNQYIFLKDKKLIESLEIDYEKNTVKVDFSKLYDNIDIAETLSNLFGKFIKKRLKDSVEFADGEIINFNELNYKLIKPLIWW